MAPVGAGNEIVRLQGLADSDRDRLLPLVGVGVAGEVAAPKLASHFLLEGPNDQHVFVGLQGECAVHVL